MKKNSHLLVILVSLVLSLYVFVFWLPSRLEDKVPLLVQIHSEENAGDDVQVLSQDLLAYIQEERQKTAEQKELDSFERELMEKLEDFHNEYVRSSQELLDDRFATFDREMDHSTFKGEMSQGIEDLVQFWVHIFGHYNRDHVVIYDKRDVGIVYSVLDFSDIKGSGRKALKGLKEEIITIEKKRIHRKLEEVTKVLARNQGYSDLDEESKRIYDLIKARQSYLKTKKDDMSKNLTARYGFAHRMKHAMSLSTRYMPQIQKILREKGLPELVSAIPFVESAFNVKAYSHAGAAGVWQFIDTTGAQYLNIDEYVDERYDPILATYAAAAHLSREFELLGSWPLTINAYNTGPGRVLKAIKKLNTRDIGTIVRRFRGSGYGFDSRNYYPEIVAAFEVYTNRHKYFGNIKELEQEKYEYIVMPADTNLRDLLRVSGVNLSHVRDLNPAIKDEVFDGGKMFPKGYFLKVPPHSKEDVLLASQELYMNEEYATYHVVKRGESLRRIASRYDIDETSLRKANGMLPGERPKKGDVLRLPEEFVKTQVSLIKKQNDDAVMKEFEKKLQEMAKEEEDAN